MPKLSSRIFHLPSSPIRKLAPFADAARARGTKVYQLNIGQPDIDTPPQFMQAISAADLKVIEYSHSAGNESLRKEIADYYCRLAIPVQSDQVLVTTGASEALSFIFTGILDEHDEVIVPEPFYANYITFALGNSGKIVPVETRIEDSFALPTVEEFEKKITPRTRAILICNPGNPTGVLYPRESMDQLSALAKKHDLFLISDEVYREFNYTDQPHCSALSLDGLDEHAIVVDSISKRFSACGARIGCVVSRNNDLLDELLKLAQARLSPPTLGQIGAEAVYQLPQSYYDSVIAEYGRRRLVLKNSLDQMQGVLCPNVDGAFYTMVRLPVEDSSHFCQWMLEEFTWEGATVMMAPGSGFYATPGLGVDQVRIAYVLNQQDLRQAMICLEQGLLEYSAKK